MTWLILLLSLYVIYCGLLYFSQTHLMFPAQFAGRPGGGLPTADTQLIELTTDEGKTTAWYVPAPGASTETPSPLTVFFHGNAELIDHQESILRIYLSRGISVLLVEYRGYGTSDGTPSEKHIVADALAIMKDVLRRAEVDASRLVLHGRSIGGGMAAQVALQVTPRAMIVESTFKNMSGMAWRYGVPPLLVTNPLRSDKAFKQLDLPILIMHGSHDEIVPVEQAYALDRIASDSTLVIFDAGHNDLPGPSEVGVYEQQIEALLTKAGVLR